MPNITLGYWNIRGLAEPIRYLLHYKNVDFEDKRYSFDDRASWEQVKFNLDLDFPNLPYYIDENLKLTQSTTILRYLARKYGLDGKTEEEKIRVSLAEQQIVDFTFSLSQTAYSPDFEKLKDDFISKVPFQMQLVARFLGNRKFLAGDSITYADFMAYETLDFYHYLIPNVFDNFPTLKAYMDRFKNIPELKNYMQSSKYVRWPFFSPEASFGGKGPEPKQE